MNTKNKISLCIFLVMISINCQKKKDNYSTNKINEKMNGSIIEKTLTKQLAQGTTYTIDEAGAGLAKIPFEMQELEATTQCVEDILKTTGFKKLDNEDFRKKIQNIFGRILDFNSHSTLLYIDFLNKCNRELVMYKNNELDYNGTFIDKRKKIITDFYYIPELIEYQKEYPQLNEIENSKIFRKSNIEDLELEIPHWKDISGLKDIRQKNIQTLVNRNKYLLNDNKISFVWLKLHDQGFLNSLVKVFGYVEDKDLLKWVLNKNLNDDEFDKLIYTKTCDNKYIFHKEIFDIMTQADQKNKEKYIMYLRGKTELPKVDDANFSDTAKIYALYCYYATKFTQSIEHADVYTFFPKLNEKKYEDEFRKNNYYTIPDFKELFEETKNGGIGLPM